MIKKKRYVVIPSLVLLFLWWSTAITHVYGPYMGKVVDAETGEPIEGAVVFLLFMTWTGTFAGSTSTPADTAETLTDKNGEFYIPAQRITLWRYGHGWAENCLVKIFKPGYGVFPDHKDSGPHHTASYSLPENKYWPVKLPELHSPSEKKNNLGNLYIPGSDEIPSEKRMLILQLKNKERDSLGFDPVSQ